MKKVTLKLKKDQFAMLSKILLYCMEHAPVEDFELESFVLGELYDRYIRKFVYVKDMNTITLCMSEAYALKQYFMSFDLDELDAYGKYTIRSILGTVDQSLI